MFAGLFVLLGVYAVFAQDLPSVRIVNNTGYTIYYVFVSPSDNEFWGNDILADDEILENGQTLMFELTRPLSQVNVYDIRLIDEEDDSYRKMGITITNNARIVFTIDDLDDYD